MKRKTLHTWLSCVALLLACLMVMTVLAGCKKPAENPTGTTADNGTSTNTPDTPTSEQPKTPEFPEACDNHKGNFICENCGRRMTPNGFFTSMKTTEADEAINVLVENLTVNAKGDLIVIEKAELTLKLENNDLVGTGYAKGSLTEKGETEAAPFEGAATLKNGEVRIAATATVDGKAEDGEFYITPDVLFAEMGPDTEAVVRSLLNKLPAFVNAQLIPTLKAIVEAHPELEDLCARIADLFLTVTKTDNGYTVALSFDRLLALNEKLDTAKVSEFYDSIFGAGAFAELETYANGVLDKKVSDVLNDLKAQGIDVMALLKMFNTLLPVDDKGNTVMSEALKQLEDETFLATTIGQLVINMQSQGQPMTDEAAAKALTELKTQIAQLFTGMKEMTVWEFIEDLMSKSDENEPSRYEAPQVDGDGEGDKTEPSMSDMVKAVLEDYKDKIKFSYTTDAFGKVLSASIEADVTLYDESGDEPVVTFAVKGKVQLVNKYTSTVDYPKYEKKVDEDLKKLTDNASKLADIVKAIAEDDFDPEYYDDVEVTVDSAKGTVTVKYTDSTTYTKYVEDGSKKVEVKEVNPIELTIDLKSILMMSSSPCCKDLLAVDVAYKVTAKNNMTVTAKWAETGVALTAEELAKYEESIVDEDSITHRSLYRIHLLLDTTTGEYRENDYDYHDYPDSPNDTTTDEKGNVHEFYICNKCGHVREEY